MLELNLLSFCSSVQIPFQLLIPFALWEKGDTWRALQQVGWILLSSVPSCMLLSVNNSREYAVSEELLLRRWKFANYNHCERLLLVTDTYLNISETKIASFYFYTIIPPYKLFINILLVISLWVSEQISVKSYWNDFVLSWECRLFMGKKLSFLFLYFIVEHEC